MFTQRQTKMTTNYGQNSIECSTVGQNSGLGLHLARENAEEKFKFPLRKSIFNYKFHKEMIVIFSRKHSFIVILFKYLQTIKKKLSLPSSPHMVCMKCASKSYSNQISNSFEKMQTKKNLQIM